MNHVKSISWKGKVPIVIEEDGTYQSLKGQKEQKQILNIIKDE